MNKFSQTQIRSNTSLGLWTEWKKYSPGKEVIADLNQQTQCNKFPMVEAEISLALSGSSNLDLYNKQGL